MLTPVSLQMQERRRASEKKRREEEQRREAERAAQGTGGSGGAEAARPRKKGRGIDSEMEGRKGAAAAGLANGRDEGELLAQIEKERASNKELRIQASWRPINDPPNAEFEEEWGFITQQPEWVGRGGAGRGGQGAQKRQRISKRAAGLQERERHKRNDEPDYSQLRMTPQKILALRVEVNGAASGYNRALPLPKPPGYAPRGEKSAAEAAVLAKASAHTPLVTPSPIAASPSSVPGSGDSRSSQGVASTGGEGSSSVKDAAWAAKGASSAASTNSGGWDVARPDTTPSASRPGHSGPGDRAAAGGWDAAPPASAAAPAQPRTVCVWDLDETLVVLQSLLSGAPEPPRQRPLLLLLTGLLSNGGQVAD